MPALDFDDLRRAVRKGELRPAYYFHGHEDLLKDDALRDVLGAVLEPTTRDFNLDRRRAGDLSADEFHTLTQTPPMLARRRAVVITEAEALQQRRTRMQALRAAVLQYLAHPAPDTVLILVQSGTADERDGRPDADLARLASAVAFDALPPERLRRWIRHRAGQEGLNLDEAAAAHLHEAVGDDLAQLAAEIAKLRSAVGDRPATADDVSLLVGVRRGETVHDFMDAVTARRTPEAAAMVPHLLDAPGASGVRLVSGLATALVGVALARALLDRGGGPGAVGRELVSAMETARPAGLRGWREEANRWVRDASAWTAVELDAALAELLRADRRLKGTTLGGDAAIVTETVLALAGAGTPT
jgi:DNA polymerase-3 subunit delta